MAKSDKDVPADETTLPQPDTLVERVDQEPDPTDNPHHGHIEPGFFAQRNPKVHHPRGKDRRINTVERRAEDRRNMK